MAKIRKTEKGNGIYIEMGVWMEQRDNSIHLTFDGTHLAVTDLETSPRGHVTLYAALSDCLEKAGAPYP